MRVLIHGIGMCLTAFLLFSCDGLSPTDAPLRSELRGVVQYVGGDAVWPTDSIYDLRVVAFEKKPTVPDDVIKSVLGGTAMFSNGLPVYVAQSSYVVQVIKPPQTFEYVVVAMRNGPNALTDWVMLSVHSVSDNPNEPSTVTVNEGESIVVNFTVDFAKLPPQPFE